MSRSGFLTYRQDLTLSVPGSSQRSDRVYWAVPGLWRGFLSYVRSAMSTAELTGRELLLSNTIALMVCVYSAAGHLASAVTGSARFSIGTAAKRAIDIVGASIGLMILAPIFLIIAIAIKFDSEGPVFFSQLRVGLNRRSGGRSGDGRLTVAPRSRDRRRSDCYGRPFKVIKFRSMVEGAERKSGPIWASRNDPRITRVGSFLRKTRFDELPQLINVLLGHMSLVGPRPERPVFVKSLTRDIDEYPGRLAVKPGITGLAQVTSGYDTSVSSVREKVRHDLQYIADWSLVQDLKILLRTVLVVVTGKGAF